MPKEESNAGKKPGPEADGAEEIMINDRRWKYRNGYDHSDGHLKQKCNEYKRYRHGRALFRGLVKNQSTIWLTSRRAFDY